jgi:alkyldihydroxyacetonephosphate synthase
VIDERSLLIESDGATTLGEVEAALGARGLTLGFPLDAALTGSTVAEWIARGTPGAPSTFADPADHVIAGLSGSLGGRSIHIRPGPRRAVGPDLTSLFVGAGGRFGKVTRAWIRVHRQEAVRPSLPLPGVDLDPPLEGGELALVEAIAREIAE